MMHLQNAGFEFVIVTPTGKPVVFEMWAMPKEDEYVINFMSTSKNIENQKTISCKEELEDLPMQLYF